MNIDDEFYCLPNVNTTTPLNSSFFPVGSAVFDPKFDILPFLCELLTVATNDSIDPVLKMPDDYDVSKHLNFTSLLKVGDPRYSDGAVLSAAFINFLPRMITQIEVKAAGGTQIINNFICDSDGNPIKESTTLPILTTVGTGGVNLYGFDIPSGLNETDLMKKLTVDEVYSFVKTHIATSITENADYFIAYLQKYYPNSTYIYSLHAFKNPPFFYVQIDHTDKNGDINNSTYIKYHPDAQDYVATQMVKIGILPITATIDIRIVPKFDNNVIAKLFSKVIPDYKTLMSNQDAADINAQLNLSTFTIPPSANYGYTTNTPSISTTFSPQILNFIASISS